MWVAKTEIKNSRINTYILKPNNTKLNIRGRNNCKKMLAFTIE